MKKSNLAASFIFVIFIGLIAFIGIGHVMKSAIRPVVVSKSSYKLVFSDEFNGKTLDASKWNACYEWYSDSYEGCSNYGNNESEWYKASQVSVDSGNLILTAQKQLTKGNDKNGQPHDYAYVSGMVSSGRYTKESPEKWSGTYGYYEARIKMPGGQSVWPAFWLLPIDHAWPPEIDVMELVGSKPDEILNTYFWKNWQGNPEKDYSKFNNGTDMTRGWHTYAVDWEPGVIDWYIDGKNVKHIASKNVPSKQMQIIFNLAIGGKLPGYPDATTPKSEQMLVDYIRVYKKE